MGSDSTPPGVGEVRRVGLALSGGGYRAAAFHLGVLDALHTLGLLDAVRVLSTVSGGSIVGAAWVRARARDERFERFRDAMLDWLAETDVLREAAEGLARGDDPRAPSLIREAARAYARSPLIGEVRLGELRGSGLEDLIVNATEFSTGNGFRLGWTRSKRAVDGNRNVPVPDEEMARVRLADAVAASSCFPGVFEPMRWPDDFVDVEASSTTSLMDGGVFDNQGIYAMDLAATRHARDGQALDLVLISDVHQGSERLLDTPPQPDAARAPAVGLVLVAALAALVATPVAAAVAAAQSGGSVATVWLLAVSLLPLAAAVTGAWFGLRALRDQPGARWDLARPLLDLSAPDLIRALSLRVASGVAILASVFMKRVRDQQYALLRERLGEQVPCVRVSIDDHAKWGDDVSLSLRETCARASETPTTLWADRAQLADLLAAGRAQASRALAADRLSHSSPNPLRDKALSLWISLRDAPSEAPRAPGHPGDAS
ncbi:MAG: patatin-like phospholipase family protein [Polyangiales bacterium]